ncbi:MAG: AbrB/MazE/SpoVT family DNA-binding domain-containing protein [Candidatus Geothermarchaeales archaeon]
MSEEAVIGKRNTLVMPKNIREKLGLKEGQRVMVRAEEGKILIEPLPMDPYKVLEDVIGEPYSEAEDETRAEEWLKRHAGR